MVEGNQTLIKLSQPQNTSFSKILTPSYNTTSVNPVQ